MNVQPIPRASDRVNEVRALTAQIVNREILPNENLIWAESRGTRLTDEARELARKTRQHIKPPAPPRCSASWRPTRATRRSC